MPQTFLFFLNNKLYIRNFIYLVEFSKFSSLACPLQGFLKLLKRPEVVHDCLFMFTSNDCYFSDSCINHFLYNPLNSRFVDYRKHLLWLSLCKW